MKMPSRVALVLGLLVLGCHAFSTPALAVPELKKVFVVILENTNYTDALKQPFLAKLTRQGATFTQFFAEAHPSQPNYIALLAGDQMGVTDNSNRDINGTYLGTLLEKHGKSWKAYVEGWPGNCFRGAQKGKYVRKHLPFISFTEVQKSPTRCARIVNASTLDSDVEHDALPDFSLYIPDLDNDGHDTGFAFADRALKTRFESLLSDPHFADDMTFVVTFDESGGSSANKVFTVLVGPAVRPGSTSPAHYDHYSLLRTIELGMNLGDLGRHDVTASPFALIWE